MNTDSKREEIRARINALRSAMSRESLDAFIASDSDDLGSEYPPEHYRARTWLTGFDGSNGTCLITADGAWLWTDGRYFLQAEKQLDGTGIELMRLGEPDVPCVEDFAASLLESGSVVGICMQTCMVSDFDNLGNALSGAGISLRNADSIIQELWDARPPLAEESVFFLAGGADIAVCNIEKARVELERQGADGAAVCDASSVAWLFGFRSTNSESAEEKKYTPTVRARAFLSQSDAILFFGDGNLTEDISAMFARVGVKLRSYADFPGFLAQLNDSFCLLYDPDTFSAELRDAIGEGAVHMPECDPIHILKAVKTQEELADLRKCHERDGISMVRFLIWLEENAGHITEYDAGIMLAKLRGESEHFISESFEPICGFGPNGAIVHYSADESSSAPVIQGSFLVADSGGQYIDGTTDITRTIWIGGNGEACIQPSAAQRRDYTAVLKAHIALADTCFRQGTTGIQLDAIPRREMWKLGLDYAHGTGHGVGFALGVHETPPLITSSRSAGSGAHVPIEQGMVFSNEPGLYRSNEYGIRIENLVTPYVCEENSFGKFLRLETLTLCPIDTIPVDMDMLTEDEKLWLNSYHREVYERLAPSLSEAERSWLAARTLPI